MRKKGLFIILLFIVSFLIGISFIDNVNANSTNNIDYKFEKDFLYDNYANLTKTNVNLKHNNINTFDYKSTYSFTNDGTHSAVNWTFGQDGGSVIINSMILKHRKVLDLRDINSSDVNAYTNFDNQLGNPTIEFWFATNDTSKYSWISIKDNGNHIFFIVFIFNCIKYNDGDWHTILSNAENNYWYHIKMTLDTSNNLFDLWLDDVKKVDDGSPMNNIIDGIDQIFISTDGDTSNYRVYYDAFGFSWKSDYYIGLNKYPIIEIVDSNLLTSDKYDFNLDSNNNPYAITGYPEIYGWNKVYSTESHIYLDMDNSENSLEILGELDGCGIKNESLGLYSDKLNITFELRFIGIKYELDSYINFTINGFNNTKIIELKFDTLDNSVSNLEYFDGSNYNSLINISNINSNDIYNFNLYIYNFNVKLSWYKNNIYNNTYDFPLINNIKDIDTIKFLVYDNVVDENYFVIKLNSLGIYQYNISMTKEYGYLDYNLEKTWDFNIYNLFEVISSELIKIVGYGSLKNYPDVYYIFREFDNKDFFCNLYEIDNYIGQSHLWFITNTSFNPINVLFSIEGIKLSEYNNYIFIKDYYPTYIFENINSDYSYFYVDNYNKLQYIFNISQNDVFEKMVIYFDIDIVSTNNRTFIFKGREISTKIGYKYIRIECIDGFAYNIDLKSYYTSYNTNLLSDNVIHRILLGCFDYNNNNFTGYTSKGYIYNLGLRNYIDIRLTIISLYLIGIMISIILIFIPTLSMYFAFKKKEIIIPMIILMTIISFATSLIPFELFFIMIITLGCGVFLQYRKQRLN